jgi:Flp pilus assembly protein TadD
MNQTAAIPFDGRFLARSSALIGALCVLLMASSALAAFDPSEGANYAPSAPQNLGSLPDTRVLTTHRPVYSSGGRGYAPQLAPVQMPQPLYPAAAAPAAAMPTLPPVDAQTAFQAQQMLDAQAGGFVAPAPVISAVPTMAAPAAAPGARVIVAPQPETLSDETRTVISGIPSKLDTPPVQKATKLTMDRVSPQIQNVLGKEAQEESYEAVGLSIKMRRPGLDTNHELNDAYTALMGGDTQRAIEIYKNILGAEPKNEDALFGLAATYHRLGQADQARPFYAMLLKQNPQHREGLNNFLVLMSEESPQDALPELERLELRNPDFSPIPAQIAIVLDKLGYGEKAEDKLLRAIELAPDNMTYKYNLAIMLDRHQHYSDASAMYRMLIDAALHGQPVPASVDVMQKRLNYITTAVTEGRAGT